MRPSVGLLVVPPLLLSGAMLFGTQALFLRASLFEDLGLGRLGATPTLLNYLTIWQDPSYLESLVLTLRIAVVVVVLTLLATWPVAYALSRMPPRLATGLLTAIVAASFVPLPIKVLGMVILFAADGPLMHLIVRSGLVDPRFHFIGSVSGVVIGYVHLAIGFMVMMLFSVMQAIPRRYEEAAQAHGAPRWRVLWRIVLPLSLPGAVGASLILFNLLTGAFVSAAILGGGRIVTLAVLIQQTLILFNDYGIAAALSAVLLVLVIALNIAAVLLVGRFSRTAKVIA